MIISCLCKIQRLLMRYVLHVFCGHLWVGMSDLLCPFLSIYTFRRNASDAAYFLCVSVVARDKQSEIDCKQKCYILFVAAYLSAADGTLASSSLQMSTTAGSLLFRFLQEQSFA